MDAQVQDIQQRLAATASSSNGLLFWEDPSAEYREAIPQLHVSGLDIVDATGRELETKRRVLRNQPDARYVIYRAGEVPVPTDDLIYDLKCASTPFTVAVEGLWAQQCGIDPQYAELLARYPVFFRSMDRKEGLAKSTLSKNTPEEIVFAMCAATLLVRDGTSLDAARDMAKRLIVEWERGNEESLRLLNEMGLADTLWSTLRKLLGYTVPAGSNPSVDDLCFRLLQALFGELVEDNEKMSTPEAMRIVSELALNPKTRSAFEKMTERYGKAACSSAHIDTADTLILARIDGLPQIDETILMRFAKAASSSGFDLALLESIYAMRQHDMWADRYDAHYKALLSLGRLKDALVKYNKQVTGATTFESLLNGYSDSWYGVDFAYRELIVSWHRISGNGAFKQTLSTLIDTVESSYSQFLGDITARWQNHAMDAGTWPPHEEYAQNNFFKQRVLWEFPENINGKRIGVIISDALRYEMGASLSTRLLSSKAKSIAGRTKVTVKSAVSMIPSYTQLGMAALLPDGPLVILPDTNVTKGGKPTQGTANRQKLLEEGVSGAVAMQAQSILDVGLLSIGDNPLVFIYHNVIDKVGDKRDTETTVFREAERAFSEIESLTAMLLAAGCKKVFITSDHGFIYQDHEPQAYEYADVKELSMLKGSDLVDSAHTRRFVVGDAIPYSDALIEFTPEQLSLEGDLKVAVPKGISRLRLQGSGARFVHGGLSPQENVIPIVCVEIAPTKRAAHPTAVEGYPLGRAVITGSTVMLDVYQVEPISDQVSSTVAIVGLYGSDGRLLSSVEQTITLESESTSSEERKTRITLRLTEDVENYQNAFLRIYTHVGQTNARRIAWEREYSINRAWGSDF